VLGFKKMLAARWYETVNSSRNMLNCAFEVVYIGKRPFGQYAHHIEQFALAFGKINEANPES
jgi:hypothetical protein